MRSDNLIAGPFAGALWKINASLGMGERISQITN